MKGILGYNFDNDRFRIIYDNGMSNDITSGNIINFNHNGEIKQSRVEYDRNYYLVAFSDISLFDLMGCETEIV